ncbi:phosphohistidine phosphatase SixA [Nocardioides sp. AE5]|uniref:phosphohistidine phosphatase SixA n=1 Tax=Nocardioides sp. AE5 TaxID=2962573 RepID=UPI002880C7D8|nr:phosphohistidine phosphatase SixA [Nocardioides sp. AE5]MDT0203609.1 phosphohistidine phosphatase SixA [Nocardioides sp. AE5]
MNTVSRRLVLVRHGQAEPMAATDHARALTTSGRTAAHRVGAWLREQGIEADGALHSSATRTTQTWEEVRDAAGFTCPAEASDAAYGAEPDSLLDILRGTGEGVGTLVMVGHNPTISYLAQWLDGGGGDPEATQQMLIGFNTAASAVLAWDGSWQDLVPGTCDVVAFRPGS